MANSACAQKRIRQERKRRAHNRTQRSRLKSALKRVLTATDAESAQVAYREVSALLDRYASRRLIHPNKAARKKSRLAKRIAAL